jgi:hypothetical protein
MFATNCECNTNFTFVLSLLSSSAASVISSRGHEGDGRDRWYGYVY